MRRRGHSRGGVRTVPAGTGPRSRYADWCCSRRPGGLPVTAASLNWKYEYTSHLCHARRRPPRHPDLLPHRSQAAGGQRKLLSGPARTPSRDEYRGTDLGRPSAGHRPDRPRRARAIAVQFAVRRCRPPALELFAAAAATAAAEPMLTRRFHRRRAGPRHRCNSAPGIPDRLLLRLAHRAPLPRTGRTTIHRGRPRLRVPPGQHGGDATRPGAAAPPAPARRTDRLAAGPKGGHDM